MSTGRLPSVDGGIQPTIVDAKGDLIVATAADTVSRLAVGSNDQVLTADSTTATGLKWATPVTGSMTLLSTTTLSGATTTISGISGNYKDLVAVVYGVTNATADGIFQLRPNAATTGCFGLVSRGTGWIGNGNNEVYLTPSSSGSGETISRSSSANAFCITISNYASTAAIKPIFSFGQYADTGASPRLAGIYIGGYNSTSAITSLVFLNSGGNLSTGTVLLYGVN